MNKKYTFTLIFIVSIFLFGCGENKKVKIIEERDQIKKFIEEKDSIRIIRKDSLAPDSIVVDTLIK